MRGSGRQTNRQTELSSEHGSADCWVNGIWTAFVSCSFLFFLFLLPSCLASYLPFLAVSPARNKNIDSSIYLSIYLSVLRCIRMQIRGFECFLSDVTERRKEGQRSDAARRKENWKNRLSTPFVWRTAFVFLLSSRSLSGRTRRQETGRERGAERRTD